MYTGSKHQLSASLIRNNQYRPRKKNISVNPYSSHNQLVTVSTQIASETLATVGKCGKGLKNTEICEATFPMGGHAVHNQQTCFS